MTQGLRSGFLASLLSSVGLGACAHGGATPPGNDALLAVGIPAPEFSVTAHDGQTVDLAKLRGRHVVLFFYPKDDTSGCTKEACSFRDSWKLLQASDVAVFGVSLQDNASHTAFAEKYQLPYPLLPDTDGAIAARYHVGRNAFGWDKRVTYLIGKTGNIERVWPNVTPEGHAGEILAAIPRS